MRYSELKRPRVGRIGAAVTLLCAAGGARGQEATELAHLVQNPIAKVISLPFQDNLNFGVGPAARDQNVLNIQPVMPFSLGPNWNLISRAKDKDPGRCLRVRPSPQPPRCLHYLQHTRP